MKKKLALTKLNTSAKRQDVKTLGHGCACSCGTLPLNAIYNIGNYHAKV